MIKYDFHGWTVENAIQEIDIVVGTIRSNTNVEQGMFITGNGVIKHALIDRLHEYGLNAEEQWGNGGVIRVIIQ